MPVALVFVPEEGGGVLNKGPNAGRDRPVRPENGESLGWEAAARGTGGGLGSR